MVGWLCAKCQRVRLRVLSLSSGIPSLTEKLSCCCERCSMTSYEICRKQSDMSCRNMSEPKVGLLPEFQKIDIRGHWSCAAAGKTTDYTIFLYCIGSWDIIYIYNICILQTSSVVVSFKCMPILLGHSRSPLVTGSRLLCAEVTNQGCGQDLQPLLLTGSFGGMIVVAIVVVVTIIMISIMLMIIIIVTLIMII